MKKQKLTNLIIEQLEDIQEATISAGDNQFAVRVTVNRNPTKEGVKVQLKPLGGTEMDKDEKANVKVAIQERLNNALAPIGLQVNEDPDIKQATDDPDVLGYYIPIAQIKKMIIDALKGQ